MFSIRITPEAKGALLEQFAFMELREPGLFIYRAMDATDVVRTPDGRTEWKIQRGKLYVVQFVELSSQAIGSPHLIVIDGIRVLPTSELEGSSAVISYENGRLYVNDVAPGGQLSDEEPPRAGVQLGPVYKHDVGSISGQHRLRLVYVADDRGFDFHSLRFEEMVDGAWSLELLLTREQFQGEHEFRRWVSELHDVQDDSGTVVMKVGEESPKGPAPLSCRVLYSWRAWDLRKNVEIRRIKDCNRPFDPLE